MHRHAGRTVREQQALDEVGGLSLPVLHVQPEAIYHDPV